MNISSRTNALGNERTFRFFSYGLVFMLMVCVVLNISILIRSVFPEWHSGVIAGAALFVAIDRLYTYRLMKSQALLSSEWAISLGAQWIVILLVVRLLLSSANGLDSLRTDLSLYSRGYLERAFSPEYVTALLLCFLVWLLSSRFLELIDEIGLDQTAALSEETIPIEPGAVPAHQRMINLIFGLGIFLVILTAMTRMNLRTIATTSGRLPTVEFSQFSGAEAGALLYFVFGLALLSLSRLMSLQTHWNRLRIPVSSKHLTRQWGIYSLLFLLLLAVIVSILPSGNSIGFFSLVLTLIGFLVQVLLYVGQLLIGLILVLFSLPFLLFKQPPPVLSNAAPPTLPTMPTQPVVPLANNELLILLRSIFLWGAVIGIIVFALMQFARQHDSLLPALRRSRFVNWLILAWQWLYTNLDKTRGSLSRVLAEGWQGIISRLEGSRVTLPGGLIGIRSLDARRRIFFFYLAMIRRGGEQKVERKPSQTPGEYARTLERALPSEQEDIHAMTEAFIKARYSRQEIESTDVDSVKAAWKRIRLAFQNKSRD